MKSIAARLLFSTALTFAAGAAVIAADNEAYLRQNGTGNALSVTQSGGSGNQAGSATSPTSVVTYVQQGTDATAANNNLLTIVQSGSNNRAGAITGGNGIRQSGNGNTLALTQSSDGNYVNRVTQSGGSTATITQQGGDDNVLTVLSLSRPGSSATTLQNGDGNWIGPLANRSGTGAGAEFASDNGVLIVTQDGDHNRIGQIQVIANGSVSNDVSITLTGDDNQLRSIQQTYLTGNVGGYNDVTLTVTGSRNNAGAAAAGVDAVSSLYRVYGGFSPGSFAAELALGNDGSGSDPATGIDHGSIRQRGTGNVVAFGLTGDDNQFGISQWGSTNDLNAAGLVGNLNDIGVLQAGNANVLDLILLGDGNDLGANQSGSNAATLDVSGDQNSVGIFQTGTNAGTISLIGGGNQLEIRQGLDGATGGDNTANLAVVGDGNRLALDQQGSNDADIDIFGNDNNSGSFATFFAGALAGSGLVPGSLMQVGDGNSLTLAVGSGLADASANLFAVSQDGNDNTINGTIEGDGNQALVIQVGSANSATFTQLGGSNYLSVTQ